MTVQEAYIILQDRLNKLSTDGGQKISKRQFVQTFNKAQLHWFTERVKVVDSDQVRQEELQRFVKDYCKQPRFDSKSEAYVISLPDDYFYYKDVVGVCGDCDQKVYGFPVEGNRISRFRQNSFYSPSLEWEETYYLIRSDSVYFYVDSFKCSEIQLLYYRCPAEIDMDGIEYLDRTGVNVDPDLDKVSVQEVLDLTAMIIAGDVSDPKYQVLFNQVKTFN